MNCEDVVPSNYLLQRMTPYEGTFRMHFRCIANYVKSDVNIHLDITNKKNPICFSTVFLEKKNQKPLTFYTQSSAV